MMRERTLAEAADNLPMNPGNHQLAEGDGIRSLPDRRKLINLHFCTFEAFHHQRFCAAGKCLNISSHKAKRPQIRRFN